MQSKLKEGRIPTTESDRPSEPLPPTRVYALVEAGEITASQAADMLRDYDRAQETPGARFLKLLTD